MRSRPFIKRTLPFLAAILPATMHAATTHAGLFDKTISTSVLVANGESAAQQARTVAQTAETSKEFSVEADFLLKSIEAIGKYQKYVISLARSSTVVAEKVASVNTETHVEIVPEYSKEGLTFRLRYDEMALKAPAGLVKEMAILSALTSVLGSSSFDYPGFSGYVGEHKFLELASLHAIAELLTNLKEGSPTAKARWTAIQVYLLTNISLKNEMAQNLKLSPDVLYEARRKLIRKLFQLEDEAAQYIRKQQKALDKWKTETGTLDKLEAMQDKLDDLILKNDRKGVRHLLEAYLPWPVMEPVEANTWKIWLEAIEHPNREKSTIAFRGLKYDTDKIQRKQTAHGEIYGFMSTVLTKNQGSYTRRLRSLSTNRQNNGDSGFNTHGKKVMSVKITDQMVAHANDPRASSFISFTYDPAVARAFMGHDVTKIVKGKSVSVPNGGMLVVKMDSRRMIPNISSGFPNEAELLAPLVVFPDEVVAYKEGSFTKEYTFEMFVKDISQKTGINFSSWTNAKDANYEGLRRRYKHEGHEFLKQMIEVKLKAVSCSKIF